MVSSKLKKWVEAHTTPLVRPLASLGIAPNHLTFLGFIASTVSGYLYTLGMSNRIWIIWAGLFLLSSGILDVFDGALARSKGVVTRFGGLFDSVADRYSDAIVLSGIIIGGLCDPSWGLAALVGSLMVSYVRSRAEAAGVPMAGVGLLERAERMILLTLASLVAYFWFDAIKWGVMVLAVLAHLTVAQRALHVFRSV